MTGNGGQVDAGRTVEYAACGGPRPCIPDHLSIAVHGAGASAPSWRWDAPPLPNEVRAVRARVRRRVLQIDGDVHRLTPGVADLVRRGRRHELRSLTDSH